MGFHLESKTIYKLLFMRDTTNMASFIIYFMSDNMNGCEKLPTSPFAGKNIECDENIAFSKNSQRRQEITPAYQYNFEFDNDVNLQDQFAFEPIKEKPTNFSEKKKESDDSLYSLAEKKRFDYFGEPSKQEQFGLYPINAQDQDFLEENVQEIQNAQEIPQLSKEVQKMEYTKDQQKQISLKVSDELQPQMKKEEFFIMKEVDPSQEQIKNTNFAKFVIKHFYKRFTRFQDYQDLITQNPGWASFNSSIFQEIVHGNGINKITLEHLVTMFGSKHLEEEKLYVRRNRDLIRQMIRSDAFLKENVFYKAHMKSLRNKKQYLLATKVYALRCRSSRLTERMETK